jgi:imidazolonepropionase-like amidohydrolase
LLDGALMKRYSWFLLFAALAVTAAARRTPQPPPSETIAFLHTNVVPMTHDVVLEDQTVVIQNGRVSAIGSAQRIHIPAGTRRIEAGGNYLIPGLTDAHVHLQSTIEFPLYLSNGVTTVFNLDGRRAHLLWRGQITKGELLGPTIFTTGPIFNDKRTAEEDIRLVDEQAAAGYDAIKIYNPVSLAEYPALIAEAKRKNLLLIGHIPHEPGLEMALAAGQSIAHLEEYTYTYFNPQHDDDDNHIVLDESKIPVVAKMTAQSGVFVVATLNNYSQIVLQATDLEGFLKNPELKYDAPWTQNQFQPANNRYYNRFKPEKYSFLRHSLAFQRQLLKALFDAGVPLMSGTDATEVGPVAGFGLPKELEEFVRDGLTPYQSLQTSTVNPARYFRQSAEFGTVEVGKRADLVLLTANPLADISNIHKISGVMVRGRWLDQAELSRKLEGVQAAYRREAALVEHDFETDPERADKYLFDHDPLNRLSGAVLSDLAANRGIADLEHLLALIRKTDPNSQLVSEESLNALGYSLLEKKRLSDAVIILRMNT